MIGSDNFSENFSLKHFPASISIFNTLKHIIGYLLLILHSFLSLIAAIIIFPLILIDMLIISPLADLFYNRGTTLLEKYGEIPIVWVFHYLWLVCTDISELIEDIMSFVTDLLDALLWIANLLLDKDNAQAAVSSLV